MGVLDKHFILSPGVGRSITGRPISSRGGVVECTVHAVIVGRIIESLSMVDLAKCPWRRPATERRWFGRAGSSQMRSITQRAEALANPETFGVP